MSEFVQVARQPIINAENEIFGYELFHRDSEGKAVDRTLTNRTLSAQVILSVYNLIGRERVVGSHLAFFNIDADFLLTDIIEALPPEQCVFELTVHQAFRPNEIAKIKYLHEKGYRFALDNFTVSGGALIMYQTLLPYITYLKVDVQSSDPEFVAEQIEPLKENHVLIAQRVETIDEFSIYRDMGFEFFQGYYIKHPQPVKHYRLEPRHFGVTRLYKMLETTEFSDFAREFERHNELCIQFFQYLLSVGGRQYDATRSVRQLLEDAGEAMLQRWMMLIVYAKGSADVSEKKSKFSRFFERRIDTMQAIVSNVHAADPERRKDELRLLAIFSTLIDIYQTPYDLIVSTFRVSKNLELWLVARKGRFSLIYKAVNQMEHEPVDIVKVDRILKSFKTDYDEVEEKLELMRRRFKHEA